MAGKSGAGSEVVAIPSLARWADAIARLEASEPLPTRVVLVPGEAHAHALRVELAVRHPRILAGTRFLTAAAAARAVLDNAGIEVRLGEEQRRPLRVRKCLRTGLSLVSYRSEDLVTPGWEEAFASSIEQLESAALRPADLERLAEPRASDLAAVWRALDSDAGASWTVPRILAEAALVLSADLSAWPFDGHTLAAVSLGIDTAHTRLLSTIPRLTIGVVPGRPARRRSVDRIRALLGDEVAEQIARVETGEDAGTELAVLGEYLFEDPARIAATDRRRSCGPDGTVALELHAGVEQELEETVQWVAEQILANRTPLQEIAILVPTPDPLALMVADRIRAMPWPAGIEPVYLACGAPAVATAAGARLLALVRTLEAFLPAAGVVELLPRLRLAESDGHVTPGRARAIASMLGTLGGSSLRPMDALRWRDRLKRVDLDEHTRMLAPALEALVAVAERVIRGESLNELWNEIRTFAEMYLIGGKEMRDLVCLLGDEIVELAADPVTHGVVGVEGVAVIESVLTSLRMCNGRYGMPSIYVGTITGAAGLEFSAVRLLGLAEGLFPGTLREDSILPAEMRRRLPESAMATNDDYATSRLHAFDQVVRGTRARLVLATARVDLDGGEREPASLFTEAAAAIARPDRLTGEPGRVIPKTSDIDRDSFQIARAASARRRSEMPVTSAMWLHHVAEARDELPSAWSTSLVLHPTQVLECSSRMDGVLGAEALTVETFGVSAESPISASELRTLLTCPQRFLLERLLRMRPRPAPIDPYRIDAASYGKLFHKVAEEFARAHGAEFGARHDELARWFEVADALCIAMFETFVDGYPLIGTAVIETERERLRRDVRTFIEHDWDAGRPRRFVSAEATFGIDAPVVVATKAGPLFLDGRIDRVDVEGGVTLVRDLKTGRAREREGEQAGPQVELDLQLAVYVAVARSMSVRWSVPDDVVAAYVYVDPRQMNRERAFRGDIDALREAGQQWFELASSLIRERLYVKSPNTRDCEHCPFSVVCGGDEPSARREQDPRRALAALQELKA